jgi:hypothetical protein
MADFAHSSISSPSGSLSLFPAVAAPDPGGDPEPTPVEKHPLHYYVGGASGLWRSPDRPDIAPDFV